MEEKEEPTWFPEAKIYHNGSHYIAIPHKKVRRKKRGKHKESVYVVMGEEDRPATVMPTLEELDTDMDEELYCPFQAEVDRHYMEEEKPVEDTGYEEDKI